MSRNYFDATCPVCHEPMVVTIGDAATHKDCAPPKPVKARLKVYRIYTENTKNQHKVRAEIDKVFQGYTLFKGVGYWRGKREQNLTIEIVTDIAPVIIHDLTERIRTVNEQEAILVTCQDVESTLI